MKKYYSLELHKKLNEIAGKKFAQQDSLRSISVDEAVLLSTFLYYYIEAQDYVEEEWWDKEVFNKAVQRGWIEKADYEGVGLKWDCKENGILTIAKDKMKLKLDSFVRLKQKEKEEIGFEQLGDYVLYKVVEKWHERFSQEDIAKVLMIAPLTIRRKYKKWGIKYPRKSTRKKSEGKKLNFPESVLNKPNIINRT